MSREDKIPNMDPKLRDEIIKLDRDHLSTLFWQVYGGMSVNNFEEITNAVESAMFDVRNEA